MREDDLVERADSGASVRAGASAAHAVILPSWLGDVVMATPALTMLRGELRNLCPGERVIFACKPGMDDVLDGLDLCDDFVKAGKGAALPIRTGLELKRAGATTCLLLPGSFSSAVSARLGGAALRIGYATDSRSMLLTRAVSVPRERVASRVRKKWLDGAPIGACDWYWNVAREFLDVVIAGRSGHGAATSAGELPQEPASFSRMPAGTPMTLVVTSEQKENAGVLLSSVGIAPAEPFILVVPGGNREDKRWPVDRFALVAKEMHRRFGLRSVLSGSPSEGERCDDICRLAGRACVSLLRAPRPVGQDTPAAPGPLGRLKGVVERSTLVLVGDTGPRHLAAALRVPIVSLFGPTDPRWTPIPAPAGEVQVLAADQVGAGMGAGRSGGGLPAAGVTDDHPERYRIDLIQAGRVVEAVAGMIEKATQRRSDAVGESGEGTKART